MEIARELGRCQVRSGTDHPCTGTAVTEIWGVPFCERCAREQAAYAAIGELTQETSSDRAMRSPEIEPPAEWIEEMRRDRSGRLAETGRLLRAVRRGLLPKKAQLEESR